LAVEDNPLPAIQRFWKTEGIIEDEPQKPTTPYARADFLGLTHFSEPDADELFGMLQEKRQVILFGPPGTGKSFVAWHLARWLTGLSEPPADRVEMIQFHPAYSYEDFIEGIRPESKPAADGNFIVDYPSRPGVFHRFCLNAAQLPDYPHVFIIDEINRGNIARIFGELMLLLEYREREVPLPYSGKRFRIPPNVYLIGTMNTADRSIALVDFALRRRFHFFHFGADPDLFDRWLAAHPVGIPYLAELYRRLSLEAVDDPDYAVGPSYFMDPGLTEPKLERIWRRSIEPYLAEYYVDQRTKINRWRWDSEFIRGLRGLK
jgi:5-methylcytosine-specific restriction protein B